MLIYSLITYRLALYYVQTINLYCIVLYCLLYFAIVIDLGRPPMSFQLFTSDKGAGICDCPRCSSVCVSVCLSVSKITQNACMDLDEILRVDRCRDTDELINF